METELPAQRAILVGIQIAGVDDVAHAASIEELGRLVRTLGYEVVGVISQKREEIDGGTVLGKGRLERTSRRSPAELGVARIDVIPTEIKGSRAL